MSQYNYRHSIVSPQNGIDTYKIGKKLHKI